MKKIQINTFGCKVNQYESASFTSGFTKLGHRIISRESDADIIVINTCSVTAKAGAQSRQAIRKALRNNATAKIVITGCYAQMAHQELAELDELQERAGCIIGNGNKHLLVNAALEEADKLNVLHSSLDRDVAISPLPIYQFSGRTRAHLRIQDGCNSFCTYCIVPYTRGRSRSLTVEEIHKQAGIYDLEGFREIVVTGIHVGCYGADLQEDIDISLIMKKLCRETPTIRYRLSSIEPLEISRNLLDVIAENNNFMPHLHIPLQSGADDILLRMNRRYSTSRFRSIVEKCSDVIEDVSIGIDILAGFPGETDKHFQQTLSFLEDLDFTYLHVFPYSRRPGTPAAEYTDQIPKKIKDERVARLRNLGERKKEKYYRKFIGSTREVLVENSRNSAGRLKGYTDNYIPVSFAGDDNVKNRIVKVQLAKVTGTAIEGRVIVGENER